MQGMLVKEVKASYVEKAERILKKDV